MNQQDQKFDEFIGSVTVESDNGWSKEVWDAAWQSALDSVQTEVANKTL